MWDHAPTPALDDAQRDDVWPAVARRAPGKVTLTGDLPPRARPSAAVAGRAVQADRGAMQLDDPFAIHLAAQRGVTGGGGPLPHLDAIQRAFGHHDVTGVRAHVGGAAAEAAAAIGAKAYATGDDVAFAGAPDVRQAAHEAAHVVQQRGGVRLDGGVGQRGDAYEQHADQVADLVVRGASAEAALDAMAHRGSSGGPAVQRIDFDGDGVDDGPARTPAALDRLIQLTVRAIAENESGGRAVATPSAMDTSSGVPASYASATQMIATHVIGTLRPHARDTEDMAATRAAYGAAHGLDAEELTEANQIASVAAQVWDALVVHHAAPTSITARQRRLTGFTDADLERMQRFGALRAMIEAGRPRCQTLIAEGMAVMTRRIADARAALAAAAASLAPAAAHDGAEDAPGESTTATTSAEAATAPEATAPTAPESAPDDADDATAATARAAAAAEGERVVAAIPRRYRGEVAAVLEPWHPPARLTTRALRARGHRIDQVETNAAHAVGFGAGAILTAELWAQPALAASAGELGIGADEIRVYIFNGTFNRFNEDRVSWERVALRNHTERHGSRTYDAALASAAEDGGGHAMYEMEFDLFIRDYVRRHPTARDEAVVRAAASHNGPAAGYADNIWNRFVRLRAAAAPTTAPTAPAAAATP